MDGQSRLKSRMGRSSLTMFLSAVRIRLIYSPFYKLLRPLRPIEAWVYKKLSAPLPLLSSEVQGLKSKVQSRKPLK